MNTRYIEADSTYRNRNLYPYPSEFEMPIAQSGSKDKDTALDPVSLAAPVQTWKSNYFNIDGNTTLPIDYIRCTIDYTNDNFIIIKGNDGVTKLQQSDNYYRNAIAGIYYTFIQNGPFDLQKRISSYTYLGKDINGDDKGMITFYEPIDLTSNGVIIITDPTDLSNKSFPLFFVPDGRLGENAYPKNILYNEIHHQYRLITGYDSDTHLLYVDAETNPVTGWSASDLYSIRKEPPIISGIIYGLVENNSNSTFYISLQNLNPSLINNLFFRIPSINQIRKILSCTFVIAANQYKIVVDKPFDINLSTFSPEYEILQFSYDNAVPFVYSGSLVSQQNEVCYEISLLNLRLPNTTLNSGQGSRIAFYPYVYVELSNVSSSGKGLTNIIYSNNPYSTNMLFRATVNDTIEPVQSTFVNLNGDGAVQTVKFKPNDNLKFSVRMPNGDLFKTYINDSFSPFIPKNNIQISAIFSIKRV